VVGGADTSVPKEIGNGAAADAIESSEIVETIDRYRKVDVFTLVKDLDPETPERLKAGNLTGERPGHRAEQRDRTHLWDFCEIRHDRVRRTSERYLPREHEAILFRDFVTCWPSGHDSGTVVSDDASMLHRST
jgi:hypothetical protein